MVLLCLKVVISGALLWWVLSRIHWLDRVTLQDGEVLRGQVELPAGPIPGTPPSPLLLHRSDNTVRLEADALATGRGGGPVQWGLSTYLAHARPPLLLLALALSGVPALVTTVRFWLLVRAARVGLSLPRAALATLVGNFFSIILPGLTGGDVPKAFIVARDARARAEGVAMIVADRIMGIFALLTLASVAALCRLDDPLVRPAALSILGAVAALLVGAILYCAPPLRRLLRVDRILTALPLGGILARMDLAVRTVLRRPLLLLATLGLGLCSHASVLGIWLTLARAFGSDAQALDVFVYTPIILVAAALPISFGGWGVRETLAESLLGRAGIVPEVAVAISVLFAAGYIVWALPGGALLLVGRGRRR